LLAESEKEDKYGRSVGKMTVNDHEANIQMVGASLAWLYRKYVGE
jgi:endonuclease YncB( thermonuclease family)